MREFLVTRPAAERKVVHNGIEGRFASNIF